MFDFCNISKGFIFPEQHGLLYFLSPAPCWIHISYSRPFCKQNRKVPPKRSFVSETMSIFYSDWCVSQAFVGIQINF